MQTISVIINGGTGTVNIQWQVYNTSTLQWEDISGATSPTYMPPSTIGGVKEYRVHLTNATGVSGCQEYFGTGIFVYINAVDPGVIGSDQIICIDGDPAPLIDVAPGFRDENGNTSAFRVVNNNATSSFDQKNVGNCDVTLEFKEVESAMTSERNAFQITAKGESISNFKWSNGLSTQSVLINRSELNNLYLIVKGNSGCESEIRITKLAADQKSK